MSSLLPDYTSVNTLLATVTNPAVTGLYLRRTVVGMIGTVMVLGGFGLLIMGTEAGRKGVGAVVQAGAAVATDGASLAVTKAAKGAASVAG